MSLAKITLYGMYRWMKEEQDDLFTQLSLPALMDSSKLVNTILAKGAEFEVLYGDPHFIKDMIGIWSDRWYSTFDRWSKALAIEYNPLENYDRLESWSDAGTRGKTGNKDSSSSINTFSTNVNKENQIDNGSSNTVSGTVNKHDTTNEHSVSAYDSVAYQPESKDHDTGGVSSNTASTNINKNDRSGSGSSNTADSSIGKNTESDRESENNSSLHAGRIHGNIGTLTSQSMLQAELDVSRFNLYDEAADLFLQEFCVYTY